MGGTPKIPRIDAPDAGALSAPDLRFLLSSPQVFLALGFGAGLSPKAPGTIGSLVALPVAWLMNDWPLVVQMAAWAVLALLGVWLCDDAGKALGDADHPAIVWDEICGMGLTLLAAPEGMAWAIVAFATFRLFDIAKPWPVRLVDQRMPNGAGAMGDDLLAAGYAAATLLTLEGLLV